MPLTEKLLILLKPAEKSALSRQATRRGISMGEVVRRAIGRADDGDEAERACEAAMVDALARALEASTARAGRALDQALRDVADARAALAAASAGATKSATTRAAAAAAAAAVGAASTPARQRRARVAGAH